MKSQTEPHTSKSDDDHQQELKIDNAPVRRANHANDLLASRENILMKSDAKSWRRIAHSGTIKMALLCVKAALLRLRACAENYHLVEAYKR